MATLEDFITEGRRVAAHRPWPRASVDEATWRLATEALAEGRCGLLGLWGDVTAVHMALHAEAPSEIAVLSLECPDGAFPLDRRAAPAGDPPRASDPRSVWTGAGRRAGIRVPGSITDDGE